MLFRSLLVASLIWQPAAGAEVFVQKPNMTDFEYRAQLKANSTLESVVESTLRSRPSSDHRDRLLLAFEQAQKAFLDSSTVDAARAFEAVAALRTLDDWDKSDREVFQLAYLRLAQLATDAATRDKWLTYSLYIGQDISPSPALFPPPLLVRQNELAKTGTRIAWPALNDGWNATVIDGMVCEEKNCPPLYKIEDEVRVTFLSNRWQPSTKMTELGRITPPQTELSLTPATPIRDVAEVRHVAIPEAKSAFYENKWFWAGVGLVVAGVIAANQKKEKSEPDSKPTTVYGY